MNPPNVSHIKLPGHLAKTFYALIAVGAAVTIAGLLLSPQRTLAGCLVSAYYLTGIGLAGLFFTALHYVAGAGWGTAIRRVPEAMSGTLPAAAAVMAVVLACGMRLYPWTHHEGPHIASYWFRDLWLSLPFFYGRFVFYFLAWILFAAIIVRNSRRQDMDPNPAFTSRNAAVSALFIVVFAVTYWLAGVDWVMSLSPDWYSTIFGVYNFTGMFQSGLAAIIVLLLLLKRTRVVSGIPTTEHLFSLGKLFFGFSFFWMYIWFTQYMLIWYANIPEEAVYFSRRLEGAWAPLFVLNIILNWAIPFFFLLPARAKKNPDILGRVCMVALAGRWLDIHLMIAPSVSGAAPSFGPSEIGSFFIAAGIFLLVFFKSMEKAAPIPINDPYLVESLPHAG